MPAVNDPVVEYNYFKCCMYKCQLLMYPVVDPLDPVVSPSTHTSFKRCNTGESHHEEAQKRC